MNTKEETSFAKENNTAQIENLVDLPLSAEQSEETKGAAGDRPSESISVNYTKVEFKYMPYDDK